jgi:YesN/AraC family two-component response regulator
MTMPNMTGVQFTMEIKKIRPDIPVILCTGFSYLVNDEKSKALGIQGFVMKPVVMKEIAETIRKVLDINFR